MSDDLQKQRAALDIIAGITDPERSTFNAPRWQREGKVITILSAGYEEEKKTLFSTANPDSETVYNVMNKAIKELGLNEKEFGVAVVRGMRSTIQITGDNAESIDRLLDAATKKHKELNLKLSLGQFRDPHHQPQADSAVTAQSNLPSLPQSQDRSLA